MRNAKVWQDEREGIFLRIADSPIFYMPGKYIFQQ
jgi:hypothetical protein